MKKLNTRLKFCVFFLFVVVVSGCMKSEDPYAAYTPAREAGLITDWLDQMVKTKQDLDTTATGLFYIVEKVGVGETVKTGNTVTVKYTGMFMDGTVFDSSDYHDGSMTYVHKGASSRMIQGWEEGIEDLQKGGKAVFLFPSAKAYGANGQGSIPPYSPLIFIIEVTDIK